MYFMRIMEKMSSPIHKHFCTAGVQESEKSRMLLSTNNNNNTKTHPTEQPGGSAGAGRLLPHLQPEPLAAAMYSLQFVADVVNRVQSALHHQCKTSQMQQMPQCETPLQFGASMGPTSCYFFIDMHQQSGSDYMYPQYDMQSCSDYKNISDDNDPHPVEPQFQRQRSISEGSDDSFICFEEDNNAAEEDDDDDDEDDDDDDDDEDESSFASTAFACTSGEKSGDNVKELRKKVHFNLQPKVHVMHAWDFAYRAARKGSWQQFARDRERFKQRINRVEPIIDIVLSASHRDRVFKDRFLDVN